MSGDKKKRKARVILAEWTDEKIVSLIGAVEQEPQLWVASLEEYRNKVTRDAAWKSISEIVFENSITPEELNKKWQGLRVQFKTEYNKVQKKKSGQGTDENFTVRWRHYEQMKFLLSGDGSVAVETTSNLVSCYFV